MTSQADLVQPPRLATWFVSLFTPPEQSESILGDLLEEFSCLASKSGMTFARRWYWRQAAKTITHLFDSGFRDAPWSTAAAIVGGFFLHGFVSGLPGKVLSAVTDRYLFYWSAHFQAYLWVLKGMWIANLALSLFVGCMVGLAAKGREMVATVTLSLILCAMIGTAFIWVATHLPLSFGWMPWTGADSFAILVGGAVVRRCRSRVTPLHV